MSSKIGLVWFKNDLRLHDNEVLVSALNLCDKIIPIFIVDDRWSASTIFGFKKTGTFRMRFIAESVQALKKNLETFGSTLYILEGKPERIIPELIIKHKVTDIFTKQEFGTDECDILIKINKLCTMFRIPIHTYNTSTLLDLETFSTNEISLDKFSDFAGLVASSGFPLRKLFTIPETIPTLNIPVSDTSNIFERILQEEYNHNVNSAFLFSGGEKNALNRVHAYFWKNKSVLEFKENKNSILGTEYSSKLSPWISQGCLSARFLYDEILKLKQQHPNNDAADALIAELLWRDYFYINFNKYGAKFFRQGGVHNKFLICTRDYQHLDNWIKAVTDNDYINANMQEIALTGWMSKPGRKHVVNYLSKQLLVDWRLGAAYFESQLLDYDVCINYGNWSMFVGVGPDKSLLGEKQDYTLLEKNITDACEHKEVWLNR